MDLSHRGPHLELVVHDDGAGFDREGRAGGLGLDNMRERAREVMGAVEVTSRPGAGTTIRLTVPATVCSDDAWRGHRNRAFLFAGILAGYLALRLWTHQSPVESLGGAVFVILFNATLSVVEAAAYFRTRPRRGRRP
jgi:hypothetical protein